MRAATRKKKLEKQVRRVRAAALVAPGEHLVQHYSHDASECSCPPVSSVGGIPTLPIGRKDGLDRCLTCSTTWPAKAYRDDGRRRSRGSQPGWLDDYLRDP